MRHIYEYDRRRLLNEKDRVVEEKHLILPTGAIQRRKRRLYTGDHITYGYMGCPLCNGTGEYAGTEFTLRPVWDQCPRCLQIHREREILWYRGI